MVSNSDSLLSLPVQRFSLELQTSPVMTREFYLTIHGVLLRKQREATVFSNAASVSTQLTIIKGFQGHYLYLPRDGKEDG